jgi:hypothetical protein
MKIKTNKLLQDKLEEQKRKSKIDKIRSSLTDEDFDYIEYYI